MQTKAVGVAWGEWADSRFGLNNGGCVMEGLFPMNITAFSYMFAKEFPVRRLIIRRAFALFCGLVLLLCPAFCAMAGEPALPAGLDSKAVSTPKPQALGKTEAEPALPAGLADEPALPSGLDEEPGLPAGLEQGPGEVSPKKAPRVSISLPFDFSGFFETRAGLRTRKDPYEDDWSLAETRLQADIEKALDAATFQLTADFVYDALNDDHAIDLESGQGWLDLREANVLLTPFSFMDLKLGRQILTWGTGDLLFINDLFPKDWNSFFLGRDTEYLKAPSDAVKVSIFSKWANLDLVYTPHFDPDRYIDGQRISYYNPLLMRRAGKDVPMRVRIPDQWFSDNEFAARIYKNWKGRELALYGYSGYWKSPSGMDPQTMEATFPRLAVYGASLRMSLGNAVGNLEAGYYDSTDDRSGTNAMVPNSELRFLVGYEREIATEFTAGLQYYLEWMQDYRQYENSLWPGAPKRDEFRHLLTMRLTKLLWKQTLTLGLFAYYSPSDEDAYIRPSVNYKATDRWTLYLGGNVFIGTHDYTFFGQFEKNSNAYLGARYSF